MDIKIRPAKISDLLFLENFQQQLVDFEKPFDQSIPKTGKVEYYNLKELLESEETNFLVAENESRVIGCGFGQIRKDNYWSVNEKIGYVGLVFVEEGFRGNGIAKLIVDKLIDWFKEKGISDIRLEVYSENLGALKAYRKCGFKDFSVKMRFG